ncbi:uncharacterized protein LOC119398948 [Rhipicephalus sanguineus]|uniref:uncharacterized protein LOC119398948 n=1 Tax=Rhipicephalus sanguineus TaxID=34632 RepID=UPI001893E849|nr:uncharacterized protein LOC119398948 [Rhipicephalus sanguineus]
MFEGVQLTSSALTLLDFQRRKIPVLGQFKASISFKRETAVIAIHVTPGGTSLLGLDAVQALGLHIVGAQLRCLCTAAEASETMSQKTATSAHTGGAVPASPPKFDMPPLLWAKFSHLFSPGLGLAKGVQHQVKMKPSVPPVVQKLRRLPLSLRKPVSDQLQRLLSDDVIERANASEWISPIVVVRKKDDSIRLCVDLREPNKAIVVDSFPLPHTEELLHSLNGARYFSKLDLASAYYQVTLHPDSRDLTASLRTTAFSGLKECASDWRLLQPHFSNS